jgi:hypothetical protein
MARVEMREEPYLTNLRKAAAAVKAADVKAASYKQVAGWCGVTLGLKGESPDDFFYEALRDKVAGEKVTAERQSLLEQVKASIAPSLNVDAVIEGDAVVLRPTLTVAAALAEVLPL